VSDNHNFDDDEDFFEEEYVPTFSRWKLFGAAVAVVVVTGFGIGIWYAYDQGVKKGVQLAPPIIKADNTPVKEKPEDPGGMDIPHQDKAVFEVMKAEKEEEKVEKLMAAPEEVVREAAPVDIPENAPKVAISGVKKAETLMSKPAEAAKEAVAAAEKKAEDIAAPVAKEKIAALKAAEADKAPEKLNPANAAEKIEPAADTTVALKSATKATPKAGSNSAAYRVQLGAFRSSDAAEKAWLDLQKKHEELLQGIAHKVQSVEIKGKGVFHRLQAGEFVQKASANGLCSKLKAQKQDCLIAKN